VDDFFHGLPRRFVIGLGLRVRVRAKWLTYAFSRKPTLLASFRVCGDLTETSLPDLCRPYTYFALRNGNKR
jgi:hypothetical protein